MNNKKFSLRNSLAVMMLMMVLTATAVTGCNTSPTQNGGETTGQVEGSEGGEHSGSEGGSESGGEHGASGEGSEEAGGSEEGSGVNALALSETYDVTNYGARMVMNYDAGSNSFIGTVENTTNSPLTQMRVEVHLSNGTELGPTTPTDMAPGEVLDIVMPATSAAFDSWTPHAEVGNSEHGAAGEGSEGGSESGSEGSNEGAGGEGHGPGGEGGSEGGEAGLETLMSSPITPIAQTWSGNLGGLDITGSYDANTGAVTTIAKNTLSYKLCYVQTEPHLKMGGTTVGELGPDMIGDLNPGETKTSVLYLADDASVTGVQFDGLVMHMEVFDCNGPGPDGGAPTINPLTGLSGGSEGSNEGTGGEGHGVGGEDGTESGGESGGEGSESGGEGSGEHGGEGSEGGNG